MTILVGPNGSGKSSVLQAVHWAARQRATSRQRTQRK
ncbi:AAA family ATPase [Mesorhizobium sp. BHbdii]